MLDAQRSRRRRPAPRRGIGEPQGLEPPGHGHGGRGLLYVQPLYLDTSADSLPTLWRVVVSFGDGQVYSAATFREALESALAGREGQEPGGPALPGDLRELVRRASAV